MRVKFNIINMNINHDQGSPACMGMSQMASCGGARPVGFAEGGNVPNRNWSEIPAMGSLLSQGLPASPPVQSPTSSWAGLSDPTASSEDVVEELLLLPARQGQAALHLLYLLSRCLHHKVS